MFNNSTAMASNSSSPTQLITSIDDIYRLPGLPSTVFTILFTMTAVVAFLGNVFAIVVLKFSAKPSKIHTYLINVSVSDVTMALTIPFTFSEFVNAYWKFPHWLCPAVQMVQFISFFVTVYTLVIIAVDRCLAIWSPLCFSKLHGRSRCSVMVLLWAAGFIMGLIQYVHVTTKPLEIPALADYYDCVETWTDLEKRNIAVFLFTMTFALPVLVLLVIYGMIAYKIWTLSLPGEENSTQNRALCKTKTKIFTLLFTIVFMFVVCWLPKQIWTLLFRYNVHYWSAKIEDMSDEMYMCITLAFHLLAMINSITNPFVYYFMSQRFRADFYNLKRKTGLWLRNHLQLSENESAFELHLQNLEAHRLNRQKREASLNPFAFQCKPFDHQQVQQQHSTDDAATGNSFAGVEQFELRTKVKQGSKQRTNNCCLLALQSSLQRSHSESNIKSTTFIPLRQSSFSIPCSANCFLVTTTNQQSTISQTFTSIDKSDYSTDSFV